MSPNRAWTSNSARKMGHAKLYSGGGVSIPSFFSFKTRVALSAPSTSLAGLVCTPINAVSISVANPRSCVEGLNLLIQTQFSATSPPVQRNMAVRYSGHPTCSHIRTPSPRSQFAAAKMSPPARTNEPTIRRSFEFSAIPRPYRDSGLSSTFVVNAQFNRSISAMGRLECLEERLAREADSPERIIVYRHYNPKVGFPTVLPGFSVAM